MPKITWTTVYVEHRQRKWKCDTVGSGYIEDTMALNNKISRVNAGNGEASKSTANISEKYYSTINEDQTSNSGLNISAISGAYY